MDALKQRDILNHIAPDFARDGQTDYLYAEKSKILDFVDEYASTAHAEGFVIGISGGIDSFLVGALLALDCRESGRGLDAVLLPNGKQADIQDARACAQSIAQIYPGVRIMELNIGPAYEKTVKSLEACPAFHPDVYTLGNLQPRLRMLFQYGLSRGKLVAGTDQASEAVTGFYTKYGDGGTDFNPIGQLIKSDIYEMSEMLGAPAAVLEKAPAAGLGISQNDERELRLSYQAINSYLKGNPISDEDERRLVQLYDASRHKRALPPTPAWLNAIDRRITHLRLGDSGSVDAAIEHMNAHPMEEVLYVDVTHPEPFIDDIGKTVNTPVARYNCFGGAGEDPQSPQHGPLSQNLNPIVRLSGDRSRAERMEPALKKMGCLVERLPF